MIGSATVARFAAVFNGWGIGYVVLNAAVSYGVVQRLPLARRGAGVADA